MVELQDKTIEVGEGGNVILVLDREQERPVGALKLRETGPTNPLIRPRVMVEVPVEPAFIEEGVTGLAEIEKSTMLMVI
jgi:hypothetical protein